MVALHWLDNKVMTLLSTNAQPQQQDSVQRQQRDGSTVTIPCPAVMALYNRYMGGMDRNDQTRQYYYVRLKSCKFYRYIFWFLFEVAAANSHILHKCYSAVAKQQPLKEFWLKLAKGLIGEYCSKKRQGRCSAPSSTLPLSHFPVKFSPGEISAWHRCWYCQHCRQPPCCRDTVWYC